MPVEDDYVVVICPHCGDQMDVPYVYDGTYEVMHGAAFYRYGDRADWEGCDNTFYVAILDGRLHVHSSKLELENLLNKFFKK